MGETKYKYDLAFTLVEKDLQLAKNIISKLNKEIEVFLYDEKQKEIVGEDGIIFFHNVFEKQSRLVIVLHRKEWGQARWTRVEEDAMKNRYLNEGQEFIILVALDESKYIPMWIPRPKIWYDMERYGIDGLAAVIEEKIKVRGKELTKETVSERLERINQEAKTKQKIYQILTFPDTEGINWANNEFELMKIYLKSIIQNLEKTTGTKFIINDKYNQIDFSVSVYHLFFVWWTRAMNCLTDSYLEITLRKDHLIRGSYEKYFNTIKSKKYLFNVDLYWQNGWSEYHSGKFNLSQNLIDEWIEIILDLIEKDVKNMKTTDDKIDFDY